tara:strand:+ start:1359 stop:2075 length:717 start_codon:yes stop_codon:yes gene_type:complete
MKVLILTTETNHHNFFVYEIYKHYKDITIVVESDLIKPKYGTFHKFENLRDDYEKKIWSYLVKTPLKAMCSKYIESNNINDHSLIKKLDNYYFDVCIVFGTSKINESLLNKLPFNTFNLHGGDPQYYRGLDSHLWSIWNLDLKGLKVCIHRLNNKLDDGEIYKLEKLDIKLIDNLFQLRSINTEVCVKISLNLIDKLKKDKKVNLIPQKKHGKYYSFMPTNEKSQCIARFHQLIGMKK